MRLRKSRQDIQVLPMLNIDLLELRSGFLELRSATRLASTGIGERTTRGADRQKIVRHDADPFDTVEVEQDPASGQCDGIQSQPLRQPCNEPVKVCRRNGNLRLAKKIRHELGRIVASGVFKVEKYQAVIAGKRIVKSEIGWRQAAL